MKIFRKEQVKVNFSGTRLTGFVDYPVIKASVPSEYLKRELLDRLMYSKPSELILATDFGTYFYIHREFNDIAIYLAKRYVDGTGDVIIWFDKDIKKTCTYTEFDIVLDGLLKGGTIHGRG